MTSEALSHETHIESYLRELASHPQPIAWDLPLVEQGLVVSLQVMYLVSFLEKHFSIQVDPFELSPEIFASVHSIAAYVRSKQQASS